MKKTLFIALSVLIVFAACVAAQETPPAPSAPKAVKVPTVKQRELRNGLKVAVVERKSVPLVTMTMFLNAGAGLEDEDKAGIADITATMLTKGTKTRSATQIANAIEFLGGNMNSGAAWNGANLSITVTSDKVDQAMAIMSDVLLNPTFSQSELDLLKTQALDGLKYNLKQPGYLSNYVASKYVFGEHPAAGTPETINSLDRNNIVDFYKEFYNPMDAVLVFAGDITLTKASTIASKYFAKWKDRHKKDIIMSMDMSPVIPAIVPKAGASGLHRILVIDLPQSGQASVVYAKRMSVNRVQPGDTDFVVDTLYYSGITLNTVLGGGYSSRLNYEIRIKRGLSYGAGSNIAWRWGGSNFSTRAQTKNESAPEVAELTMAEIKKLTDTPVAADELIPRKSVLTGNFGRDLETTRGLAAAIGELFAFGIPSGELNAFIPKVNSVTASQLESFAKQYIGGGDIIIVGDYSVFKDDLAKRFPGMKVDVIKADDLDLSKDNLRK